MNTINNKIISRFYVITLNKKPVYVGYTNRPIQQRFNEHKRDKDFGNIKPAIKQIAQLEYDFTWDTNKIDQYANEVNDKECKLIKQYNTQNSKYQKANGGGQNWADIKYFVNTNYNNPKFQNMSESEILKHISEEHIINTYIRGFNMSIDDLTNQYMKHFVTHMKSKTEQYLESYCASMFLESDKYIRNFVKHINSKPSIYLSNFINHMNSTTDVYVTTIINNMNLPPESYLKNFIHNMQ